MEEHKKRYLKLFTTVFTMSALTFGGGYVMIPLMKKKYVEEMHWLDSEEMLNLMAVAQTSPGAIAVNTLFLAGYKTAGIIGAFISIIAAALPPFIVISTLIIFYASLKESPLVNAALMGTRAGVAAVIFNAAMGFIKDALKKKAVMSAVIVICVFTANFIFKINVLYIIIFCICLGALMGIADKRRV